MAHVLFSNTYNHCTYTGCNNLGSEIRLSIFLLAGECVGLPAVVWALRALYHHRKSGGRVSAFIVFLLLCDSMELLLSPYIVTELIRGEACWETSVTCRTLSSLWSGSRSCGFFLQQVVALEGALSLRHPLCFAQVFFPSCFIIIFIIVFIWFFLGEFLSFWFFLQLSDVLMLAMMIISWILTFRATTGANVNPSTQKKPDLTALDITTFMMLLYSLWVAFWLYLADLWVFWMMCTSLMSLRVIFDPLLCVWICRQNHSINNFSQF